MKSALPYFMPTEVIFIDDEQTIINMVQTNLSFHNITLKYFDQPLKAVDYIEKQDAVLTPKDLDKIPLQIYSSDRYKQISTIIVDYDMPGMNGLEVCRQIALPHVQKIMLTGAATTDIAVEAFNEGIIHHFIQKDDPDVYAKLQNAVMSAQEKYFEACTLELIHQLQNEYPEVSILQNPEFVDLFKKITHENKVIEHYLSDPIGSFLFLSETGKASALFVFNEEMLESQEDMIPELDRHTDLAQEIYNYQKAICFYPFNTHKDYVESDWKKYIHPLSQLDGKSTYYWAYAESLSLQQSDQVISFSGYKADLETR